jgi:hypothetical protein
MWWIKSRILWLKSGDWNTSFFHQQDKLGSKRSSVREIIRKEGSKEVEIDEEVKAKAAIG